MRIFKKKVHMKFTKQLFLLKALISIALLSFGCLQKKEIPLLEQVLALSAENRVELEKVLFRYKQNAEDSLKYRAAVFLIENMPYYYYFEGELLDNYESYYRALHEHKKKRYIKPSVILDSIRNLYGDFALNRLEFRHDLLTIDSAYLCNNIEWSFKVWREQPWGKHVSFEEFCEYILPYRIDDEKPTYWREDFYERYNSLLDTLRDSTAVNADDPLTAVRLIMQHITEREDVYFTTTTPAHYPHITPALSLYKSGNCRELTGYAVYVCRALGIPCHIDFMPVRGDDNVGHFWISYTDKYGELYVQDFPETVNQVRGDRIQGDAKVKVYRHTFGINASMKREMEALETSVPPLFKNPRIVDVTFPYADYFLPELKIPASQLYPQEKKPGIVYLCLNQHMEWAPVAWAKYDKNQISFPAIQKGSVLRVAGWENNRLHFLSDPFTVEKFSNKITFYSCNDSVQDIVVYAKSPEEERFRERMVNGAFEGSNMPDFREKDIIYRITESPYRLNTTVFVHSDKKYRYVRYYGPDDAHCNIAEASLYENAADTVALLGTVIGTAGCYQEDGSHEYPNVFDGNTETSFDYKDPSGGWAGLDLRTPKTVKRIVYTPRNRDNYIRPGDTFEVFYCDREWKSLGVIEQASDSLAYSGVPVNALLLVKNHTRGVQERIFTFEKGKQIWK
jgi:transglutaminase-like putative cysteine protease